MVLDAVLEIFSWVGLGGGALLAAVAVGLWAADGSWLPATGYVEHEGTDVVVRWIDADGAVDRAVATGEQVAQIGGQDTVQLWHRVGRRGWMRLTRRPPGLRPAVIAAAALAGLGLVSAVASIVVLSLRG